MKKQEKKAEPLAKSTQELLKEFLLPGLEQIQKTVDDHVKRIQMLEYKTQRLDFFITAPRRINEEKLDKAEVRRLVEKLMKMVQEW